MVISQMQLCFLQYHHWCMTFVSIFVCYLCLNRPLRMFKVVGKNSSYIQLARSGALEKANKKRVILVTFTHQDEQKMAVVQYCFVSEVVEPAALESLTKVLPIQHPHIQESTNQQHCCALNLLELLEKQLHLFAWETQLNYKSNLLFWNTLIF